MLMCTEDKREWLLPARAKAIQVECVGSTHGNFLNYGEPDDHVTRQAMSDRQQDVCWLQVHAWHHHSYIAGIPLLAHINLIVKLS